MGLKHDKLAAMVKRRLPAEASGRLAGGQSLPTETHAHSQIR